VASGRDRWAQWVLVRRHGADAGVRARNLEALAAVRERVLENADVREGDVVLDVGAGDGLIGFAALERVGESGRVLFCDISTDLLGECRRIAAELGVAGRCDFVRTSAADLEGIADASVDVVTTRSVLIYLDDKRPAFEAALRVLRPGGRLSIFEPINRFGSPEARERFLGFDVSAVQDLADKVKAAAPQREEHPLLNFDERDLFRFAAEAGFAEVRLDLEAELRPWPLAPMSWEALMRMAPNPLDPTFGEQIAAALEPKERAAFEAHLRPLVERGAPRAGRRAHAYLRAVK
jgi:arsenite methyltransferase